MLVRIQFIYLIPLSQSINTIINNWIFHKNEYVNQSDLSVLIGSLFSH